MRPSRLVLLAGVISAAVGLTACGGSTAPARSTAATPVASASAPSTSAPSVPAASTSAPVVPARTTPAPVTSARSTPRRHSSTPAPRTSSTSRAASVSRLPLGLYTGDASQVITVVAASHSSTTATLQAWRKAGSGWARVGPATEAHLGSNGIGVTNEGISRTPQGSFTLTQAFGHDSDPGTALPYTHTTPADWWISESGPLYNTRQHCSAHCDFTRGDPNEHLYYETPYYNYAVVIDYNTANAPGGVRQGAGSAFFLHVTDGGPTAGCVSIDQDRLVTILRWLQPGRHPRILLGVG